MNIFPSLPLTAGIMMRDLLYATLIASALESSGIASHALVLSGPDELTSFVEPGAEGVLISESGIIDGPASAAIDRWIADRGELASIVVLCARQQPVSSQALTLRFGNRWALIARESCSLERLGLAIQSVRGGMVMFEPCGGNTSGTRGLVLSETEQEVLQYLAAGHSNAAIARKLHVSEKTVERTLRACYRKLGLSEIPSVEFNQRVLAALRYHGLANQR